MSNSEHMHEAQDSQSIQCKTDPPTIHEKGKAVDRNPLLDVVTTQTVDFGGVILGMPGPRECNSNVKVPQSTVENFDKEAGTIISTDEITSNEIITPSYKKRHATPSFREATAPDNQESREKKSKTFTDQALSPVTSSLVPSEERVKKWVQDQTTFRTPPGRLPVTQPERVGGSIPQKDKKPWDWFTGDGINIKLLDMRAKLISNS
jgi:hypothetical protein